MDEAIRKGLAGIAVTDHNTGAWVDKIKEVAVGTPLVVFPGVEITCRGGKEGLHVIALLDVTSGSAEVESLLSELGLQPKDFGKLETIVEKDATEVVTVIDRRGGLAVLAHVNSTRGAFNDMRGQQRISLIRHPCVHAAEGTDFTNEDAKKSRKRAVDLLDGNDPDYGRKMAVYQASDNPGAPGMHSIAGIGTRCAFFKMDRIDLDALRQCFCDPDVRIRQDFEIPATPMYPRIISVRVTGGFLSDLTAQFHEGLNSVLGAKGAGKSLLVEFLRFTLDQPPLDDELRADHAAKLRARLEDYGTVEVIFGDETGKRISLKRTFDESQDHPYEGGAQRDLVRTFPVFFLSQNEILRIAENHDAQLAFIDRFFDFRAYQVEIAECERELSKLDHALADSMRAMVELPEAEKQTATVRAEVEKLDALLKNPVFDTFSKLELKDRTLRAFLDAAAAIKTSFREANAPVNRPAVPAIPDALKDEPMVRRVADRAAEAAAATRRIAESGEAELLAYETRIREEYAKWRPEFERGKKEYESAIQSSGDQRALVQRRAKLVKEQDEIARRFAAVSLRAGAFPSAAERRKTVVAKHRTAHEEYAAERKDLCKRIAGASGGRLTVEIEEGSNSEEFRKRLSALKRGSYLKDVEIDRICANVSSGQFMRAVIQFALRHDLKHLESVATSAKIELAKMRTLAEFLVSENTFESLLALEYTGMPQDRPDIRYYVVDRFEPLDRLSIGQKCTAMLLVALSSGTAPVVIDQPEDSLDLRTIWEDVCSRVRVGKERRQFIFTTHNSSVAVATDSDKFIIMEADATRGRVVFSGSMDHEPVGREALKYLEGGAPTYRLKFRKYRAGEIVRSDDA